MHIFTRKKTTIAARNDDVVCLNWIRSESEIQHLPASNEQLGMANNVRQNDKERNEKYTRVRWGRPRECQNGASPTMVSNKISRMKWLLFIILAQ